jgi:ABC-type multidrug transport system fused ATPase/permease subunit
MNQTTSSRRIRYLVLFICIIVGLLVNLIGPFILQNLTMDVFPRIFGFGFADPTFSGYLFPIAGYLIMLTGLACALSPWIKKLADIQPANDIASRQELDQVIKRVQEEPLKVKPAWDLARVRLEQYFDRNLSQVRSIFWLSLGVMVLGFFIVIAGISQTFTVVNQAAQASGSDQNKLLQSLVISPALVGGIAGIITEFLGATFLFVYRSTVQQAGMNIRTLERIHSVGMAMQILDTISDDAKQLQDSTKAEIVKSLLAQTNNVPEDYAK